MTTGVYTITNKTNNKIYVGSSTSDIDKRLYHHKIMLNKNKHKNTHLQNAWNKYGESEFNFEHLEYCDVEFCLSTEQWWINMLNVTDRKYGYNINPIASGTPNMSKETIAKRAKTMKDNFKNEEFRSRFCGRVPWNKGKSLSEEHILKLKNAERIFTESGKLKKKSSFLSKLPKILIYTLDNILLQEFNNIYELSDWSLTIENNLPMSGRFSKDRKGKSVKYLSVFHMNRVCIGKIESYKGLKFKYE